MWNKKVLTSDQIQSIARIEMDRISVHELNARRGRRPTAALQDPASTRSIHLDWEDSVPWCTWQCPQELIRKCWYALSLFLGSVAFIENSGGFPQWMVYLYNTCFCCWTWRRLEGVSVWVSISWWWLCDFLLTSPSTDASRSRPTNVPQQSIGQKWRTTNKTLRLLLAFVSMCYLLSWRFDFSFFILFEVFKDRWVHDTSKTLCATRPMTMNKKPELFVSLCASDLRHSESRVV